MNIRENKKRKRKEMSVTWESINKNLEEKDFMQVICTSIANPVPIIGSECMYRNNQSKVTIEFTYLTMPATIHPKER